MRRFTVIVAALLIASTLSVVAYADDVLMQRKDIQVATEADSEASAASGNIVSIGQSHVTSVVRRIDTKWVNIGLSSEAKASIGVGIRLLDDIWAAVNIDRLNDYSKLRMSAAAIYKVPKSLLIWSFYGGGGLTYSVANEHLSAHAMFGTEYLFFFSEYEYLLEPDAQSIYRTGIRLKF